MKKIKSSFSNYNLLTTALTHRSALNEKISLSKENNERLEFLGDAVLELITTEFLFKKYPKEQEGILTAYRSSLVKTTTLAEVALEIGLEKELFMSKGEEATGGRKNIGLLADALEALIGAMYLDQGHTRVVEFLSLKLFPKLEKIRAHKLYKDAKSLLQEVVQAEGLPTPTYEVVSSVGPDHDKEFVVRVMVGSKFMGEGKGKSKQSAQQVAARQALEKKD